jgi:catechol 2,3-dioxygenase-like lactoylglutathione lyase family enzyme
MEFFIMKPKAVDLPAAIFSNRAIVVLTGSAPYTSRKTTLRKTQMQIEKLDHLVLTVRDIPATCAFYESFMGMKAITFAGSRKALVFSSGKINLHEAGNELEPKALRPTPGSADLCFITETPVSVVAEKLRSKNIPVLEGPVKKTGAFGPILSIYFRDPDGNLIEISNE